MWSRLLALLVVVALVPTAELTEQVVHVVEHVLEREDAAHSAHHDEAPADCEHGCTGLIHLCACHTTVAVTPAIATVPRAIVPMVSTFWSPARLHDTAAREPADRPPIG
ncbi:MAG TPA: hypothetical protein VM261_28390 [Kofleriaceae bacterium]|nr:hypothetical protein [Kofleriaceae bacterium]